MRTCRGVGAVLLVAALAWLSWLARPAAAAPPPTRSQLAGQPTGVLVLVGLLTWEQAAGVARSHGGPVTAGLVSTLPAGASLQDRVLSLAAGRPVDAAALGTAAGASGGQAVPGGQAAAVARMRAANPDARFGGLPGVRVLAGAGMEAAGLLAIRPAGAPPPPGPLPAGAIEPAAGELLVLAVPDAAALAPLLARVRARGAGVMVVGLRSPPARARTAPLLLLGGASGVATSDSTRTGGLAAYQDVRPTLTGSAAGTQGVPIRTLAAAAPLATVGRLDREVAALVSARSLAIVLYAVLGSVAIAACLAALLLARVADGATAGGPGGGAGGSGATAAGPGATAGGPGGGAPVARAAEPSGAGRLGRVLASTGRGLLLASLAVPSGYLIASAVAPASWVAWLLLGLGASAALAVGAWLWSRGGAGARRAVPAPALLGALVTGLVVLDLLAGGAALNRPLLGNSAFDGERFYGLGNGYFAHALAGVFLMAALWPLRARLAAVLLVCLAVVDGLPGLGADVGGALTAMLSAVAVWLLLGRWRPSLARAAGLAVAAVAAAAVVAVGVGLLLGESSHGGSIGRELLGSDPGAGLRAVGHQLAGNFGLLASNFWAWWGPLMVAFTAFASVRPPALLAGVPDRVRRVAGAGAIGSALLILFNDTGVTAAAGSGLALVATLAWAALEPPGAARPERL